MFPKKTIFDFIVDFTFDLGIYLPQFSKGICSLFTLYRKKKSTNSFNAILLFVVDMDS